MGLPGPLLQASRSLHEGSPPATLASASCFSLPQDRASPTARWSTWGSGFAHPEVSGEGRKGSRREGKRDHPQERSPRQQTLGILGQWPCPGTHADGQVGSASFQFF